MDLLARRYASPFPLLDNFIQIQQLHEFTLTILDTIAEEKVQDARWEYYLHKVFDISFEEYVRRCENKAQDKKEMSLEQIGEVVSESRNILKGYIPS